MTSRTTRATVFALIIVIAVLSAFIVVQLGIDANSTKNPGTLFQLSAFNTFSSGNFEGNTTFAELEKNGDFGIGTLNGLNGEMIALNGVFYQIPTSGTPRQIGSSEKTPYATVTFFRATQTTQLFSEANYSQLTIDINSTLPDKNAIYALKIQGFFESAKTRSVPIQTPPFPTLTEAVKNQTVFNLNGVEGTAVGFYFPDNMNGVDSTGFHLHFLTDDHQAGGHLLECSVGNATVEIAKINNYYLKIP